jgi:hypothetical protein
VTCAALVGNSKTAPLSLFPACSGTRRVVAHYRTCASYHRELTSRHRARHPSRSLPLRMAAYSCCRIRRPTFAATSSSRWRPGTISPQSTHAAHLSFPEVCWHIAFMKSVGIEVPPMLIGRADEVI